jgi:hypothetical protein
LSAQIARPLCVIGLAFTLLACGLAVSVPNAAAVADDCLKAPNSPAPSDSHWYYHTDRAQGRQCWHIRAVDPAPHQAAPTTPEAPIASPSRSVSAANPYSLASFKDFMAQRGGTKLSDQEVENLYAAFLEWNQHTKN